MTPLLLFLALAADDPLPPAARIELLGGSELHKRLYREAVAYRRHVAEHVRPPEADPFPSRWRPWCEWHYAHAEYLYGVYDNLTTASMLLSWGDERSAGAHLKEVRRMVGDAAYFSGRLPPVP